MTLRPESVEKKFSLTCPVCDRQYGSEDQTFLCKKCSAPTVVALNLNLIVSAGKFFPTDAPPKMQHSLWKYFQFLPLEDPKWIASQGEGLTPLAPALRLAERLGIKTLLLKNETVNPTGSFKDRQISFSISKAREAGAKTIAVVSSGNVAASAASYAAMTGLTCKIFTPSNAPEEKLVQARMYGATFHKVNTLSSSRIFQLVAHACKQKHWYPLSTAGLYNPFHVEGAKTIAYELTEHYPALPDWIFAPVGGGGLLGALWRGFSDMKALGLCTRIPRLVGVQSSACTPLVQAIAKNLSPAEVVANPVEVGHTIAGAIADDILFDAYTAIPAIRKTDGLAVAVSDEEMLTAEKMLAQSSGVFAEPASAATVAALKKCIDSNLVPKSDTVCCIITGSGFKDMASAKTLVDNPIPLEPSEEAFARLP